MPENAHVTVITTRHVAHSTALLTGQKLRCVGSALSPNGLAFSKEGMLSLALLDKVLRVNVKKAQVTVQAGARVQEVRTSLLTCLQASQHLSVCEWLAVRLSVCPSVSSVVRLSVCQSVRLALQKACAGGCLLLRIVTITAQPACT